MISLPKGRYTWVIFTVVFLSLFGFTLSVSADDALEVLQQATIEKLETIESTVDAVLDKVENRTRSSDLKADIQENKEEIDELMEQQSQAIQDADSIQEVKELVIETAQRIILKTYDGITGEEGLDDVVQIDGTPAQKAEAVDVALKSMVDEETGTYTIQLTTKASFDEAVKRLKLFDDTVEGVLLFDTDGVVTIEVTIDENSILSQEVLTDLEYGQVPDALVGFRINKPEVFRIEEIDLEGEQLNQLRGIREYATYEYLATISQSVVTVGVLDTGVDMTHPDLVDRISTTIGGYDFYNDDTDPTDDEGHGTHVAGTIAGSINGGGIVGVNPYVEIVPLKICNENGSCPSYAISNAIKYAIDNNIDILNMSLGGPGETFGNSTCAAVLEAQSQGVIPIIAAGNANTNASTFIPAGCGAGVVVGAIDSNEKRGNFSNYGSVVDVAAPGVAIYSAQYGGGYITKNGTSMATPHVVGLVSIIHAVLGEQSVESIKTLLLAESSEPTYEPEKPIGMMVNVPALMETLGVSGGEGLCEAEYVWNGDTCIIEPTTDVSLPLLSNRAEGLTIRVGTANSIKIWDGVGTYGLTRTDPEMLGYGIKNTGGEGVFIASAEGVFEQGDDVLPPEPEVVVDDEDLEPVDESEMLTLGTFEETEEVLPEGVSIASAKQNPYKFRVVGMQAGETSITINDTDGRAVVVPITIKSRVLKLNNAKNRKWIKGAGDRWKITDIVEYDEEVLAVKYMGEWKWRLTGLEEVVTTIRVAVFNEVEQRSDVMEYTLLLGDAQLPVYEYTDWSECVTRDECTESGTQTRTMTTTSCVGLVCDEEITVEEQICHTVAEAACFITSQDTVAVDVGSSIILDIAGGAGDYGVTRDNENIGFGDGGGGVAIASTDGGSILIEQGNEVYDGGEEPECEVGCEEEEGFKIASDSAYFTDEGSVGIASTTNVQSIKLLGLKPGETVLTITDAEGQEKEVKVTVNETMYRMRSDGRGTTPNRDNRWFVGKRELHTVPQDLLSRFSYYRDGKFKISSRNDVEGEGSMMRTIYNNYEQKFQEMHWLLRVAPTKEKLPFEVSVDNTIEIEAGSSTHFNIRGGLPNYHISHSNDAIRLSRVRHAPHDSRISFTRRNSDDIINIQENPPQGNDDESENSSDDTSQEQEETPDEESGTKIAAYDPWLSLNQSRSIEIHGLVPGESFIVVKDQTGQLIQIRVLVTEKTINSSVGGGGGRYYRRTSRQDYYVHSIESSNPDIVSAYRDGKSYMYSILQPGKATITVMVSENGAIIKPMQLTVVTPSDTPLDVSQERITMQVGDTQDIELSGGLPKYVVSKSNENIGLGSRNLTTAIGVAGSDQQVTPIDLNYIVNEGDDVYEPYDGDDESSVSREVDGGVIEWEIEEEEFDSIEIAAGVVPEVKPNHLSIIGLQPGVSTVTVVDEIGDSVEIEVEVLPKRFEYKTFYGFSSESSMVRYGYNSDRLSRGKYDRYNPLYTVERITVADSSIYIPYFRRRKGWYGKGAIGGTTIIYWEVYLPLEKKKGRMEYEVFVDGPTIDEINEHAKKVAIHKAKYSGKASSINPGGGSFPSDGGESSSNDEDSTNNTNTDTEKDKSKTGEFYYIDATELNQRVGEFSVINLYVHPDTEVTTKYDETKGFMREVQGSKKYKEKILVARDEEPEFLGLARYELVEEEEVISIQDSALNNLIDGFEKKQYIVGCAGEDMVYTKEMTYNGVTKNISIYCSTYEKPYSFKKGYSETLDVGNLPIRTAYSDDDSLVSNWYDESKEELGLIAKEVGSTYLNREFYGLENNSTSIAKFKIKVDVVEEETEKEVINIQVNAQVGKVYELTVPNDDYEVAYHRSFVLGERNKKEVKLINKRGVAVADAGDFLSFGWDYIKFAFKKKPEGVYKTVFSPTSPGSFKYTLESKNTDFIVTIAVGTTSVTKDIYREWISGKEVFKFQEQDLTIEEYTYKLFELAYFEVLSLPYDVRPIVFYEKFSDTGPWNFKFSLIELGYLKEKGQRFNFNGMSINGADLGNLMFGYLSHHGGFYDNALKRANDLETIKYRPYYGEELGRKRTYIDEANDIPFYKAGKTISIPSNDLYLEMLLAIKNGLDGQVDTAKLEEEGLKEICDKTYGKYIEGATKAANICLEKYYSDYYIIVDKPFSILKMVVVPKKDGENLIPIPIIKYD